MLVDNVERDVLYLGGQLVNSQIVLAPDIDCHFVGNCGLKICLNIFLLRKV